MRQEFVDPPKPPREKPGAKRIVRPTLKQIKALVGKLKRQARELEEYPSKAMLAGMHPDVVEREVRERKEIILNEFKQIGDYLEGLTDPSKAVRCSLPKKKQRELGIIS